MRHLLPLLCLLYLTGCTSVPDWQPIDFTHHPAFPYYPADYVRDSLTQDQVSHLAFLGLDEEAYRLHQSRRDAPWPDLPDSCRTSAALPALLESAASHRICLINEAHHLPHHRAFTRRLLSGLFERGYRHLALEAITFYSLFDSLANTVELPLATGYYFREPEMAELAREAQRIGYRIFGYDDRSGGPQPAREIAGANHIARVARTHPNDKVLVHCGYAHAREGVYSPWGKALAQFLADSLGTDPLTVSQTAYATAEITEARVVNNQNCRPASDTSSQFDFYVLHPNLTTGDNRPDYKWVASQRVPRSVDLPKQLRERGGTVWVFRGDIRPLLRDSTRTFGLPAPLDVLTVNTGAEKVRVAGPQGRGTVIAQTSDGKTYVTVLSGG